MGVATICILLCHTSAYANLPGVIIAICNLLNIGVDLFLFLSGFGLYYSLVKLNNDRGSLVKWYSHRYLRIGIPYFLIYGTWNIIACCLHKISIQDALLHISTISFWTHHDAAWFVALLIPLYLLAPVCFYLAKQRYGFVYLCLLALCCYIFSAKNIPVNHQDWVYNLQCGVQRIPGFLLGFALAPFAKKGYCANGLEWLAIPIVLMVVLYLGGGYSLWIMVIPLLFICVILFERLNKRVLAFLGFMGGISLESYLTNGLLGQFFMANIDIFNATGLNHNNYLMYATTILAGVIISYAISKFSNRIINQYHL